MEKCYNLSMNNFAFTKFAINVHHNYFSVIFFCFCVQDRLEIILNKWIESGYVPSPAEVSKEEGVDFLWSKGEVSTLLLIAVL
jgi:hypothetical protein